MVKLIVIGVAAAIVLALFMRFKDKLIKFMSDVSQEMSKVSWPTFDELKQSTTVVIVLSLIFVVYIFVADTILTEIIKRIL